MTSLKLLVKAIMGASDWPSFKGKTVTENLTRAFMYGESVFTTMKMQGGELKDWELHFERLCKGVEFLYGPFTDDESWITLLRLRLQNKLQDFDGDQVMRLTVYRSGERGLLRSGMISVSDLKINFHCTPFDPQRVDNKLLKLRTCSVPKRPHWWPSYLKAGNYLETIICQKMFMKPGDDDLLFLSESDTVLESSVANIFAVKNNKLYTAPTGPSVLDGIMRKKVLVNAEDFFDEVEEVGLTLDQIIRADGVFGSNSIRGLFLVDRIDDYAITYSEDFLEKFEKLRNRVQL